MSGYIRRLTYVAHGRDEHGWWRQDELDGPKIYGPEAEATLRAVFPDWMLEAAVSKKSDSNGDEIPEADPSILQRILGKAKSEQAKQEGFWRTHTARERSRQARIKARDEKKGKGK